MRKIILGLAALIILAGAGYWYASEREDGSISSLLSDVGESLSDDLEGKWKLEQRFAFDATTQQFKEVPPDPSQENAYIEFRDDRFCLEGKISSNGNPVPCSKYVPFRVDGNKIVITPPEGEATPASAFEWALKKGMLELIIEIPNTPQKLKVVFVRF